MDKAARAALLTAKGIKTNRPAYAEGGGKKAYHATQEPFENYDWNRLGQTTKDNTSGTSIDDWASSLAKLGPWSHEKPLSKKLGMKTDLPVMLTGKEKKFKSLDHLAKEISRHGGPAALREKLVSQGYGHASVDDEEFGGKSYVGLSPEHFKITKSGGGSLDSKSENIADYVADLLRQGRAKEVTDDLMAQADPQRLHHHYTSGNTGMDLPMDQASRMERAAKMGFRTDLFHGTHKDFPAFDERPVYASNNPNVASTYASPTLGNIMPLAMRGGENSPVMNAAGGTWNRLSRSMRENENAPILEKKQPTHHDINFGVVKDGEVLGTTQSFSKAAKAQGYSGMTFNDVKDKGVWAAGPKAKRGTPEYEATKLAEKSAKQPSTVEVRFDPTNIRSQFARFDPRLEHLAHLSASTGGAMEFARHVEAVNRAGGQIAPSKYLPNVPRAVHAGGGKVENFKKWFSGSRVVHEDGTPMKMVHASHRNDIKAFRKSQGGIWFSPAHDTSEADIVASDTGRGTLPNPDPDNQTDVGVGATYYPVHLSIKNPATGNLADDFYDGKENVNSLTKKGYDGVKYDDDVHVAFHPQQIKSAIGNNGNFDPNDPDMTKAGGGRVDDARSAFLAGNHPDVPDVLYHGSAPKIVENHKYHGDGKWTSDIDQEATNKNIAAQDFRTFRPSEYGNFGKGIYLSDSPNVASNFAQGIRGEQTEAKPYGQVFKLHVSMKKPFTDAALRHPAWKDYIKDEIKKSFWGQTNRTESAAADDLIAKLDNDTATVRDLFVRESPDGLGRINQFGQDAIHKTIRNSGFDGIIAHRPDGSKEYVAFKPEQVKSATGNQGTFDPNDPDITKSGGGEVVNLGKEKLVRSITKAVADVKSGAHQENMDRRAYKLHESGHLPLPIGTKVTPPQGWDMPSELHIHGYWQDILHPDQHGYKLKSENGDVYEVQHQMHSGQNPYVFGGGFKAYSGPVRNRAGYSDEAMASKNPILPTRTPEQSDQLNKEYDQLFGNDPDITKSGGGRIHAEGGGKMDLRSKAAQVIRNQPQAKGNVDQMLAMMAAKGVKPSELLNAGRPFGHSVSKEELAQHFENAVPKVQITKYGEKPLSDDEKKEFHDLSLKNERTWGEARRFFDLRDKVNGNTQYSEHSLPGGENYREHLLHLPKGYASEPFYSDHWQQPNVFAHLRMKDRDNSKTLHVEEVQSDWGQQGREKGFYDPVKPIEVFHTGIGQTVHATDDMGEAKAIAEKLGPQYDYGRQDEEKVPQGPYVGNTQHWTDLAVKHALTEAAKGGHDRVVFSPGEANADLYGQRTPISQATLVSPLTSETSDYLGHLYGKTKKNGSTFSGGNIKDEKDLIKALGKQHAKALLSQAPSSSWSPERSLSEPDMVLGGHGMVDYYNNIVHPAALKLLRQHDPSIQPESYDLPNGYKGFALPMTDKARQSILDNGFQAFKDGGTVDEENPAPDIKNPMSVFPKPQRMFPEDQRPKGGQYISAHNKADVTGHKAETATIGVHPGGKPFFHASQNAVDQTGTVGKGSATTKTNLFKQKAGWKWQDTPEGHEKTDTIVSVEHRGKHFYALNAHFPKGVDLARYENATSEPRLRPTTQGNVTLGPQAGSIVVRGKMHPVYHHVIVKADGGTVDDALALTRRFTKDGNGATLALKSKGK